MKIDLSTILLVIICIIPGLFAQRSRNLVCPRSFDNQGTSAELGELVALGISTHGVLICISAVILLLMGIFSCFKPTYFFHEIDSWSVGQWCSAHPAETTLFATLYVFISFSVSHALGLIYGGWRLSSPITTTLLKKSIWLKRRGIHGLLVEKPIVYEALKPKIDAQGTTYLVFVELTMKNQMGFYTGQVSQFAIVKDEEPHKPVFLINAWFRESLSADYQELQADGVMLDLADASQILVKQIAT